MEKITVYYHNKVVGVLGLSIENDIFFQYDSSWISNGFSISPLKLPLTKEIFKSKKTNEYGLFGVFLDSLPDSWGKLLFRKYIIKKYKNDSFNGLDYLSFIGSSGMGALEYYPVTEKKKTYENYDFDLVQQECNDLLDSKEIKNLESLYHLGSSSGGARPKILIKLDGVDYIVKFSSKFDNKDIATIEYEYCLLARKCGVNVPDVKLIKTNTNNYFAIKRFDRNNTNKVHMISVAALLDVDFTNTFLDYTDLIKLTDIITRSEEDKLEMFRRMVFNVVFGNLDDHIKNFSFIYKEDEKKYRLSPAYDLTNCKTDYNEHTTTVNGKGRDIFDEDMLIVARETNINLKDAEEIINLIRKIYKEKFNL